MAHTLTDILDSVDGTYAVELHVANDMCAVFERLADDGRHVDGKFCSAADREAARNIRNWLYRAPTNWEYCKRAGRILDLLCMMPNH